MDMILDFLIVQYPVLGVGLMLVGTLTTTASTIVSLTPTKKDDKFLAEAKSGILGKVIDFVERFSAIRKKVKK